MGGHQDPSHPYLWCTKHTEFNFFLFHLHLSQIPYLYHGQSLCLPISLPQFLLVPSSDLPNSLQLLHCHVFRNSFLLVLSITPCHLWNCRIVMKAGTAILIVIEFTAYLSSSYIDECTIQIGFPTVWVSPPWTAAAGSCSTISYVSTGVFTEVEWFCGKSCPFPLITDILLQNVYTSICRNNFIQKWKILNSLWSVFW